MAKLITQEEAAQLLGVSSADVSDMRQQQQLYGVRDGGAWKFKQEDVERLIEERAAGTAASGIDLPVDLDLDGPGSQIVLSEFELGDSGPGSSTVIGSSKKPNSDLDIVDSGLNLNDSGPIVPMAMKPAPKPKAPEADDASVFGSGSGLDLLASDVRLADPNSSNVLSGSSDVGPAAGRTMLTAELVDKPLDSSIKLTLRDTESVFGDPGSDVTRNLGGSGINLLDPKDSGMLLDDLDLSGASGISRIGGDTELKGDDDFLLTPLSEQTDDTTDSGSQVIALDGDFGDDATATLLAGEVPGLSAVLEGEGFGGGGFSRAGNAAMAGPSFGSVPDTRFGIGSVATLGLCSIVMTLTGIMMYDIIRNMWSFDKPLPVDSTLMDMILGRR
ncbi:MAG: helix-turn-helix domain-containing protein [Planctomycetia bacterium]|nr:helix-turn-helix domain-containing protein [Planctomycetia bacterium]